MKFSACPCGPEHLDRVPRSWWMRLVTSRRHYQCSRCGATMFIAKVLTIPATSPMATSSPATKSRGQAGAEALRDVS